MLNNIGMCMSKLRRFEPARRVFEDAAQICDRRWAVDGEDIAAMYAGILDSLAAVQGELGRLDDAMEATRRLVPLARQLALSGSPEATAALARALRKFALMRAPSGAELDEALAAATEAATIFGQLAVASPPAFDREVQVAHAVVAGVLEQLGRHQEAASIRQAMNIVGVPWQARDTVG
jgi:tetratricopeptide (TPR) repeat protein